MRMSLLGLHCLKPNWKRDISTQLKLMTQKTMAKGLQGAALSRVLERE